MTVLAARDPHGRYYPASTLKTLTLLTLAPRLDPAQVVDGTPEDEQVEGSRVGLVAGGRYPVALLFQALVLQSGNDAANALARAAGGIEATVDGDERDRRGDRRLRHRRRAPSGLDIAGQSSSPYDLALIFRDAGGRPGHRRGPADADRADAARCAGRSAGYQIQNQNPLAGYPGILGGKTGFTDAARHTFVTAAERDGRRLVVSVMDTENCRCAPPTRPRCCSTGASPCPPGTDGVGRLADSGGPSPPEPSPRGGRPAAAPAEPAGRGAGRGRGRRRWWAPRWRWPRSAVVVVTVVGRRRAVRRVPPRGPMSAGRTGERVLAGDGPGSARRLLELGEGLHPELGREIGQPAVGQLEHVRHRRRGPR